MGLGRSHHHSPQSQSPSRSRRGDRLGGSETCFRSGRPQAVYYCLFGSAEVYNSSQKKYMIICGYARVSTTEQAEDSRALEQQIARLEAAGATEIYCDVASGSKDKRPDFVRLMQLIKAGERSHVVVTRLDRLSRSLVTLRKTIDEFQQAGATLQALDDNVDLRTAAGKFHLNILGALAEMEVDRIRERVKHGWSHRRQRQAASNAPFGYRIEGDRHRLDTDPFFCWMESMAEVSKAVMARELIDLFLEKKSLQGTIRAFNQKYGIWQSADMPIGVKHQQFHWCRSGLSRWLRNPVLQGHLSYPGAQQIIYDTHPDQRLMSAEEAREVDAILTRNYSSKGWGAKGLKYPLSGLVFCGECGSKLVAIKGGAVGGARPIYYQCHRYRARACGNKPMIRETTCETAAIAALVKRAEAIATIAAQPADEVEPVEVLELRRQLAQLEGIPGFNQAIEQAKVELRNQIEQLKREHDLSLQQQEDDREALMKLFSDARLWTETLGENSGVEGKQRAYRMFINRVVVNQGQISRVELKI